MTTQILTWILTIVGLTGFFLAGRKIWWAWYVNIANQLIWFAYAVITQQWAFLIGVAVYTVVFTQNAIKWTRDRNDIRRYSGMSVGEVTEIKEAAAGLSMNFKIIDEKFAENLKTSFKNISILGPPMVIKKRRWYHKIEWDLVAPCIAVFIGGFLGIWAYAYIFWR